MSGLSCAVKDGETAGIAGVVRSGGEVTVEWFADNSRVDDQIVSLVVALYDSNKKCWM